MREHGREIVMIGHAGHPEVEGTMGQMRRRHPSRRIGRRRRAPRRRAIRRSLAYVTQTTLSVDDAAAIVDALKRRFPRIVGPKKDDICYATQNRQDAVKFMAPQVDVVIVVGSPNSSNSNRLREVAAHRGVPAYMVDRADELEPSGSTARRASASPPARRRRRFWCSEVIARLKELGAGSVRELDGAAERVVFPMPKGLPPGPCVGRARVNARRGTSATARRTRRGSPPPRRQRPARADRAR